MKTLGVEKKKLGISIDFTGLSFRDRVVLWWAFTRACLFMRNLNEKTSGGVTVGKIDVFSS